MYIPKSFQIEDEQIIHEIIEQYSFATLISFQNNEPVATHLPLLLNKEENYLYGHFARPNQQWKNVQDQQSLAIFHGPHSYISPSWYETDVAVPTWNYVTVHVYGKMEIVEDAVVIAESLKSLVDNYEPSHSPYQLQQVDATYVENLSKGIVAFKLPISKIEAKAKLSQNHPEERKKLVITALENSTNEEDRQVAAWMKRFLSL